MKKRAWGNGIVRKISFAAAELQVVVFIQMVIPCWDPAQEEQEVNPPAVVVVPAELIVEGSYTCKRSVQVQKGTG